MGFVVALLITIRLSELHLLQLCQILEVRHKNVKCLKEKVHLSLIDGKIKLRM